MTGPQPLELKPDLPDAARRWEAYYQGEIIDRPLVVVTAPRQPRLEQSWEAYRYRDRVYGDLGEVIDRELRLAEMTYFAGESMAHLPMSFGPDEIAAFCGAELK